MDKNQDHNPFDNRIIENEIEPYLDNSETNPLGSL